MCEKCEEKNLISEDHPHYFIKIRNEYNEGEEILNNIINDNSNNKDNKDIVVKKEYSYDCLNKNKLSKYVYEEADEAEIEIILKNNGKEDWPKDCTKLIFDRASDIVGDEIVLEPQKSDEQKIYHSTFKKISKYRVGEYKSYLLFCVNDETFGEKSELSVGIKKDKNKLEIEQYIDKINEFRNKYELKINDHSNEKIIAALKNNDFNYEIAFSSLFDDNNV